MSLLIRQKLIKNARIEKLRWDILGDFQTLCEPKKRIFDKILWCIIRIYERIPHMNTIARGPRKIVFFREKRWIFQDISKIVSCIISWYTIVLFQCKWFYYLWKASGLTKAGPPALSFIDYRPFTYFFDALTLRKVDGVACYCQMKLKLYWRSSKHIRVAQICHIKLQPLLNQSF